MSSKRYIRRAWNKLKPINTWYFFAAFVVFLAIGVYEVRQNNLTALKLRDEVLQTDKANGDVSGALNKLREFTYSHMNAGLATGSLQQPIQLKYTYERLVQQQENKISNKQVYADAQKYCEKKFPLGELKESRVPCVQNYVSEHTDNSYQAIPDALYKFDFVSPFWSPDLAGWSLLLAGIFLALFVIRFLTERWFKAELKSNL